MIADAGAAMPDRCVRCGAPFRCGIDTGHCWCADLPALPLLPAWGETDGASADGARPSGCLCPECLRAALVAAGRLPR